MESFYISVVCDQKPNLYPCIYQHWCLLIGSMNLKKRSSLIGFASDYWSYRKRLPERFNIMKLYGDNMDGTSIVELTNLPYYHGQIDSAQVSVGKVQNGKQRYLEQVGLFGVGCWLLIDSHEQLGHFGTKYWPQSSLLMRDNQQSIYSVFSKPSRIVSLSPASWNMQLIWLTTMPLCLWDDSENDIKDDKMRVTLERPKWHKELIYIFITLSFAFLIVQYMSRCPQIYIPK